MTIRIAHQFIATASRYRILVNENGQLLFAPIVDREQRLWQNPQAIALVQTGIVMEKATQTIDDRMM